MARLKKHTRPMSEWRIRDLAIFLAWFTALGSIAALAGILTWRDNRVGGIVDFVIAAVVILGVWTKIGMELVRRWNTIRSEKKSD